MPNITETISLLDELRGKLNNGLIGDEFDDAVWEFVKAYDTILRQAALDGERYRKAGETLAEAASNVRVYDAVGCFDLRGFDELQRALSAYRRRTCEHTEGPCPSSICTSDLHSGHCTKCDVHMWTPPAYRQAVEQKEV